jgi:hypothetical protein
MLVQAENAMVAMSRRLSSRHAINPSNCCQVDMLAPQMRRPRWMHCHLQTVKSHQAIRPSRQIDRIEPIRCGGTVGDALIILLLVCLEV